MIYLASSAMSEIVMFVAVLLIAAFVAGILTTSTYKISLNINKKGDALATKLSQDFEIIMIQEILLEILQQVLLPFTLKILVKTQLYLRMIHLQ